MHKSIFRYLALAVTVVVVLGVLLHGYLGTWARTGRAFARPEQNGQGSHDMSAMPAAASSSQPSGHEGHAMPTNAASPGERRIVYWYDPMHPTYKSDKPGIAPDCGMQLVPKYADEGMATKGMPSGTVMIPEGKQQLIGVTTALVLRQPVYRTIQTVGQLAADETKIAHVHVKVNGWIDRVFVNFEGQFVRKGQPLFTLYSPDLVATQREYLIAKRGKQSLGDSPFANVSQGADSLVQSARERLRLWDISDEQIAKLDETGQVSQTLTFYSPSSGFVLERKAFPQTAVNPDTDIYTIASLSTVWAMAEVYEYEVPYVHVGQRAEMELSYYPGKIYTGRVAFVYPTVDPQTRTVKVRLEFANAKLALKPGMFSEVSLKVNYGDQVVVPQDAVLDSGNKQTVFVALPDGYFEPREIKTGPRLDGNVVVLAGLKPGETIVSSGNFLIDSESRLKSAMAGMQH